MSCKCGGSCGGPIIVRPEIVLDQSPGDITVDVTDHELQILCDDTGAFLRRYSVDPDGVVTTIDTELDGITAYAPVGTVTVCTPDAVEESPPEECGSTVVVTMCDTIDESPEPLTVQFLRRITFDCEGAVVSTQDLDVDGLPYTPQGEVGQCQPETSNCGLPEDAITSGETNTGAPGELQAVESDEWFRANTDTTVFEQNPDAGAPLWAGGSITMGPDTDPAGGQTIVHRWVAATLAAERPECDNGVAHVTASITVENLGPGTGCAGPGRLRLVRLGGGTVIDQDKVDSNPPVGHIQTLTVEADVVAADLEAGNIAVQLDLETYHLDGACPGSGPKAWEASDFLASYAYNTEGCGPEGPSMSVRLCEPVTINYTPPPAGENDGCSSTTVTLCEIPGESPGESPGDPVPFLRTYTTDCNGVVTNVNDTDLDGNDVDVVGEVGLCGDSALEEACPRVLSVQCVGIAEAAVSYDNTSTINGVPGGCGSIHGPTDACEDSASFCCQGGPYTITSWIINNQEVITPGAEPVFQASGNVCGNQTGIGLHDAWVAALSSVDPNTTWVVDKMSGCAWFVRAENPDPTVDYGPMIVTGDGNQVQDGTWNLTPKKTCVETQYAKLYTQQCDGTIAIEWLDEDGNSVAEPEGEKGACGICAASRAGVGGGGSPCGLADTFTVNRCDDVNGDGSDIVQFVEVWSVPCDGTPPGLMFSFQDDPSVTYEPVNPTACPTTAICDTGDGSPGETTSPVAVNLVALAPDYVAWDPATQQLCSTARPAGELQPEDSQLETDGPVTELTLNLANPVGFTDPTGLYVLEVNGEAIPLDTIGNGPTAGTLANGVGWTVDNGVWIATRGTYSTAGGALTQTWTFDQPVTVTWGQRFNHAEANGPQCVTYAASVTQAAGGGGTGLAQLVKVCGPLEVQSVPPAQVMVSTGISRMTGAATEDVAGLGQLQSVTVTVVAGEATVTTASGTAVVPAGTSLSWSVQKDQDQALDVFSVETTNPADDAIVHWTVV